MPKIIENRMRMAKQEISHQGEYGHVIINENIEIAVEEIIKILHNSNK